MTISSRATGAPTLMTEYQTSKKTMASSPYFFFRTILAKDQHWAGFDWQCSHPSPANMEEYVRCLSDCSATLLAKSYPLVIPADQSWLAGETLADQCTPSDVILVFPEETLDNAELLGKCKELRSHGFRTGIDIRGKGIIRRVPVAGFDFLRMNASFAHQEIEATELGFANDAGFGKIATSVNSYEMFAWLTEKHFDLCDSHFLTTRNPHFGKEPDMTRLKLLKLLHLVKEDGDTREIEAIFREEPKLSYNLLRLVNSLAVGARTKISSFSQAIAILGRRQLQRWLQLLVYANNLADGNAPNPLMQLAAARGRQLELLCAAADPRPDLPEPCDNAFMTGLFSLLDVLVNLPMKDVLRELPMHDDVVEALLNPGQGGTLSQLLLAIILGESGDFDKAGSILEDLQISPRIHAKAQSDALYWASRINIDNHD